jgi:hypothetical protein
MGQFGNSDSGDMDGGGDGGGLVDGHLHLGHDGGHDFHHDHGSVDADHVSSHGHHDQHSGHDGEKRIEPVQVIAKSYAPKWQKLLGIISPLNISIFLTFFGLTGLLIHCYFPTAGHLKLIPAAIAGYFSCLLVGQFLRRLTQGLYSNSLNRRHNMVGIAAEVSVSIAPGKTGEITCKTGSGLYVTPAKAKDQELSIPKGSIVIINDIKDHVFFVEPCDDPLLLESARINSAPPSS